MSEIVILMAAGLGTRMRPLTDQTPKPLIKVHEKPMIETIIEGLRTRKIDQFIVVTGYKSEQFDYLPAKYENLVTVFNKDYESVNNISSIYTVSDLLMKTGSDVFICEADLYIKDPSIFQTDLDQSCYFGRMVPGHSDDWVFDLDENGRIIRVGKYGDDCFNMVGVAYFRKEDANKLGKMIREAYGQPGYESLFWDDVVDRNLNDLDLNIHEIKTGQIIEIDTVEELKAVNSSRISA